MVSNCIPLAMANLMLALMGLVAFVARDWARDQAVAERTASSKRDGPKMVWVTSEVMRPSALANRRRRGRSI